MSAAPMGGASEPGDTIFRAIARHIWEGEDDPPALSVLDAGTGRASMSWLLRSRWVGSWTAVTASASMEQDVRAVVAEAPSDAPPGRVVRTSWDDPLALRGERFDVVLADYLLGSLDGFTPYQQDLLFERLSAHVVPGGLLVVVGLEPIPNSAPEPGDVVCKCARLRDAMFLHAGQRAYREYPRTWVLRALERAGFAKPGLVRRFPIIYTPADLMKELRTARSRLEVVEARSGKELAAALSKHIDDTERMMRQRLGKQPGGKLTFGEDYVICARWPGRAGSATAGSVSGPTALEPNHEP